MLTAPKVTNVTLRQLAKIYNVRREGSESKPVALIADLKAQGQQTPLDVYPASEADAKGIAMVASNLGIKFPGKTSEQLIAEIEAKTGTKWSELYLILRGHCRTQAFQLIQADDPIGFEQITDGGKIKVRIWKDLTQAQRDELHHDHANEAALDRQEFYNSLLKQISDRLENPVLAHGPVNEGAKETLTNIQVDVMRKNFNLVKIHSGAAQESIDSYEQKCLPPSTLPIPEGLPPARVAAEREARARAARLRESESRELLIKMTRGLFQKLVRIIQLPFVYTVFQYQLNGMAEALETWCTDRGMVVPDWCNGMIPDIAGPKGTGSDTILKALEKAYNADGKTVGPEYIRVWMEESDRYKAELARDGTGKPRAKSMGKPQVEAFRADLKSEGAKALVNKILQESVNDPLILQTDEILRDIEILTGDKVTCDAERFRGFTLLAAIKARATEIRDERVKAAAK